MVFFYCLIGQTPELPPEVKHRGVEVPQKRLLPTVSEWRVMKHHPLSVAAGVPPPWCSKALRNTELSSIFKTKMALAFKIQAYSITAKNKGSFLLACQVFYSGGYIVEHG